MKKFLFIATMFLIPSTVFGAIAIDTTGTFTQGSYSDLWDNTYTVTGSETYIYATLRTYANANQGQCNPSAMSYNGVSMRNLSRTNLDGNTAIWTFALLNGNADGASHTLRYTSSGGACGPFSLAVASYKGVRQVLEEASSTGAGSASVTTVRDNSWVIGGAGSTYTGNGASTTLRVSAGSGDAVIVESSLNPITPTSSVTLAVTNSYVNNIAIVAIGASTSTASSCRFRGHARCH